MDNLTSNGAMMIVYILLIMVGIAFLAAVAYAVYSVIQDRKLPRLTVPVTVLSKWTRIKRSRHGIGRELYYASFLPESGDCIEMNIPKEYYDMISEKEDGMLTLQGSRFIRFQKG